MKMFDKSCNRQDADFPIPYGGIEQVREHPIGEELDIIIKNFGESNTYLWKKDETFNHGVAAWLVSNCKNLSKRDQFVERLKRFY